MMYIFYALVIYLLIDILAFIAWIISGQIPVDTMYIGNITAGLLSLIL